MLQRNAGIEGCRRLSRRRRVSQLIAHGPHARFMNSRKETFRPSSTSPRHVTRSTTQRPARSLLDSIKSFAHCSLTLLSFIVVIKSRPQVTAVSLLSLVATMSRHHPDLVMCRKQTGISIGRLCDKCDGKCPVCDSYVRPTTIVRICDECSFGNYQNKCIVCGGEGISDAFYCFECTRLEKDRDGCPKIINLGSSRTDLFYQKKNFRNH